jgi:hypothetical protein
MSSWPALFLAMTIPGLPELQHMIARFAPVEIRADVSGLSSGDRQALTKLIEAARLVDDIFLTQLWSGNQTLYSRLKQDTSPLGKARLNYFWLNKGPWSDLDDYAAFIPGVPPRKLPGADFYPEDMHREEFEAWAKTLPEVSRRQAEGFFTVIGRNSERKLTITPYSQQYQADLTRTAKLLHEAAALTDNQSLRTFLNLRAEAFLSNDYYTSDVAWMDLDAPLDITIGPYETYNDELFGYKAAYEAYVNLRDDRETERLKSFSSHLQEIEDHLPIEPRYRNPKLGASAPIRVVNEILAAGDGAHGVRTAAYNLPNDERVVHEKGSKRVMLKNIQEAKFHTTLEPIAARILPPAARAELSFDSFFTHILAHELSHGIGPGQIQLAGRRTTARQELKDLYSAIEEAKADATGLFMLQYLFDHGIGGGTKAEHGLYTTYLASTFRTLRFGLTDAHGKGMALQFNYLFDKGAFVTAPDGEFAVNYEKIKPAVRDLVRDLLTLEAEGNYSGAGHMLNTLGVVRPAMRKALDGLKDIPTDILPIDVTADALASKDSQTVEAQRN